MFGKAGPLLDSGKTVVEQIFGDGDHVAAVLRIPLRDGSGEAVMAEHWTMRDGKAVELDVYWRDPTIVGAARVGKRTTAVDGGEESGPGGATKPIPCPPSRSLRVLTRRRVPLAPAPARPPDRHRADPAAQRGGLLHELGLDPAARDRGRADDRDRVDWGAARGHTSRSSSGPRAPSSTAAPGSTSPGARGAGAAGRRPRLAGRRGRGPRGLQPPPASAPLRGSRPASRGTVAAAVTAATLPDAEVVEGSAHGGRARGRRSRGADRRRRPPLQVVACALLPRGSRAGLAVRGWRLGLRA